VPNLQSKSSKSSGQRWFPSKQQLSPEKLEQTLRQVLTQHYALQDKFDALHAQVNAPSPSATGRTGPPPGSGPSDTMLLGLRVVPVDTQTLANGATLKFNKVNGNFSFS
jgi:hypothetical protein